MAFCKFSTEYISKSYTLIDNVFFTRYLPNTPPKLATIYLYGLYLCSLQSDASDNTSIQAFAESLGYSADEILDAFYYWEEQGLVRIVSKEPAQVQYLPMRNVSSANKKYDKDKYSNFNVEIQKIITDRMITPNEFQEYYSLMEGFSLPDGRKLSPEALIMVVRYCVKNKGANVGYRYILTVAQNWAREGFITPEQIEQRLDDYTTASNTVNKIMKALGSSKKTSIDEHELYIKWSQNWNFTDDVICAVAKSIKKSSGTSSFEKLDRKLQKYHELNLLSEQEINDYEKNKDKIYSLARDINKTLGLYYDDVTNQVETYINPWLAMGFEPKTLLEIAQNCYLKAKRTLSALNETILDLYNKGIVTENSYQSFQEHQIKTKDKIAKILQILGIQRNVTSLDEEFWQRWTVVWGFDDELINFAVSVAQKRGSNLSYVNSILADWHTQNIFTLQQAEQTVAKYYLTQPKQDDTKIIKRKYTKEEQESIFDNFKEIDL